VVMLGAEGDRAAVSVGTSTQSRAGAAYALVGVRGSATRKATIDHPPLGRGRDGSIAVRGSTLLIFSRQAFMLTPCTGPSQTAGERNNRPPYEKRLRRNIDEPAERKRKTPGSKDIFFCAGVREE
jgi:hypothetical protein